MKPTGVHPGALPGELTKVLRCWARLLADRDGWGTDTPWWYNERASLSQLVGAIWRCRGWAFEEYSVKREGGDDQDDSWGRCDLMFELTEFAAVAEAKPAWPKISRQGDHTRRVKTQLRAAMAQVDTVPNEDRYRRLGIVFVAPILSSDLLLDECNDRVKALVDQLIGIPGATVAWAFPEAARRHESVRKPGTYWPGSAVVIVPRDLWQPDQ